MLYQPSVNSTTEELCKQEIYLFTPKGGKKAVKRAVEKHKIRYVKKPYESIVQGFCLESLVKPSHLLLKKENITMIIYAVCTVSL